MRFLLSVWFILVFQLATGQTLKNSPENSKGAWFIALPLRFTHIQDNYTMLSGIQLGKEVHPKWSLSLSIYHSFYLKGFKPPADLLGFSTQPRLFINGMGVSTDYQIFKSKFWSAQIHGLIGWGFMTYDLNEHSFRSQKRHFLALEPTIFMERSISPNTLLGLGVGYRPLLGSRAISYESDITNGDIQISKNFPNGLNILLTLKGYLRK